MGIKPYNKNWIDKLLTHERDMRGDYGSRVVLHLFIGFVIGLFFPLSYPILKLFIAYEDSEDFWVHDRAWKDYAGALAGSVFGVLTSVSLIVYLVIRLLGGVL